MPLTVKQIESLIRKAAPGATADGNGLYLKITPAGNASWQFRYQTTDGKRRMMGLGACNAVSITAAREQAQALRVLVKQGIDPLAAKEEASDKGVKAVSFAEAATRYVDSRAEGWSNPKHVSQWRNTLATYCVGFAGIPVADVTADHVEIALRPIWLEKTETATRVLMRITAVLTYAHDKGWRAVDDADSYGNRLRRRLPMLPKKTQRVRHHPALPYPRTPEFMRALQENDSIGARELEFAILCASRSSEVRLARWCEIDLDAAVWTIPAERMKARTEHRVPLAAQAVELLRQMATGSACDHTALVFANPKTGKELSDMTLTQFIRRRSAEWRDENGDVITQHGFRSTFRDWAAETTPYPRDVAEMALAHTVGDKVEAAYRRGDLFEKRRGLMQAWADYCHA